MSKTEFVVSGQGGGVAAGRAGSGLGTMLTAGTTVGAAGMAAQPGAGTAGAPRAGGSAGQAGSATAGGPSAQAGTSGVGTAGKAGAVGGAAGGAGTGGVGTAGRAGAAGGAGTGATDPGDPCPMMLYVDNGVPVSGAGCKGQWEGIVMTQGGRGLCTAAFISDRHLISASHCYAQNGAVSLRVSAPTWENGAMHTFQAQVKRSGSSQTLDISIIDLGAAVPWATPERRFVLHAGKAAASGVDMHLYGFGSGGPSGGAGKLRGVPNRATIHVTDNGRGNLNGKAGQAQLCTGDSGGPAFVEKTAAVLYGINQAIVPSGTGGGRTCADPDWTIMFTNVSQYMSFIEMALGKMCERKRVDDLEVAQCW